MLNVPDITSKVSHCHHVCNYLLTSNISYTMCTYMYEPSPYQISHFYLQWFISYKLIQVLKKTFIYCFHVVISHFTKYNFNKRCVFFRDLSLQLVAQKTVIFINYVHLSNISFTHSDCRSHVASKNEQSNTLLTHCFQCSVGP